MADDARAGAQTRTDASEQPAATGKNGARTERYEDAVEFLTSVLAALAVIFTAYSAYEATRWSGVQATDFAAASSLRTQAASLTTLGATEVSYDASVTAALMIEFRNADFSDPAERERAITFAARLFRDEAKPALEEWLRLAPLQNPNAPDTPLQVPSYHNANLERAEALVADAELRFDDAKQANQHGDDYVLATILFASVLFFTSLRIKAPRVLVMVQAFAVLCLIGGVVRLMTLPFQ